MVVLLLCFHYFQFDVGGIFRRNVPQSLQYQLPCSVQAGTIGTSPQAYVQFHIPRPVDAPPKLKPGLGKHPPTKGPQQRRHDPASQTNAIPLPRMPASTYGTDGSVNFQLQRQPDHR